MPRVIEDRRADGFARLGVAGARGLGLPASRSRALEIESAWRRIAGASIAGHTRVIALRRGALEIEVPDLRWRAAVERFATELLARFAREAAPLGVDTIRIVDARSC
jgi:predicted nucleic acid-binding Zn ribbon protein